MRSTARALCAGLVALASSIGLLACSSGAPSATTTSAPVTTTSAPVVPTTTIPLQTPTSGEFLSPSGNISCEIDVVAPGPQIYCQTVQPMRSARLAPGGTLTVCTGNDCLGNPGLHTPTLAYGTATGARGYECASAPTGMTCRIDRGYGFTIARAGVTPRGGVTVVNIRRQLPA